MSPPFWAAALLAAVGWGQDYRDYLCREIREPFFRESKGTVRAARREANPISFAAAKPPGTVRILVVGESVARLWWSERDDALTAAAARAWPGRKVEHLNAGMTAYNSRRIAGVLEEGLAYGPDLAIVLSGNNEHEALELCPGVWEGLERQFRASELFRRLRSSKDPAEEGRRLSLARHEWQLREMARAAKAKGVPLVLAMLPANERDYPPGGAAPWDAPGFAQGLALLWRGRREEAAKAFRRRLQAAPRDAFAHWFLAQALEGDPATAALHYEEAVRLDPRGDRCSVERNAMIRRVAEEEGGIVADLAAAFRGVAGGAVGGQLISDGVHWYPRLHPLVANAVLAAAASSPFSARLAIAPGAAAAYSRAASAPTAPTPAERREESRKVLLYGIRQVSYWSGTDRDGDLNEVAVVALGRVEREARSWLLEVSRSKDSIKGLLEANFWVRDLAEDIDLWWPVYLAHLGEALRRRDYALEAVMRFDEAVALSPKRRRYRLWRALALDRAGRTEGAGREGAALREFDRAFSGPVLDAFGIR